MLLAFIALASFAAGNALAAIYGVAFVCFVFLCVLLHEFGHALAARRYGIRTPDITMLPIGGLARLERMPDKPTEELVVALAGPLVNVVIALLLAPFASGPFHLGSIGREEVGLLTNLRNVNIWLVLFNLIPAFPMDGGRVLRAFLAMRMDYARATAVAASIGQSIAVVGGLLALVNGMPMLVLIAIFIFAGAQSEAAFAQFKHLSASLRVQAATITSFQSLPLDATLNDAVEALLASSQHDFPVLGPGGDVRGLLTRDDLIVALRKTGADTPVAEVMRVDVPSVHHTMLFDRALAILQESGFPALPVVDSAGRLVGLFTPENVSELLLVKNALARASSRKAAHRRTEPPPLPV
ncbi:MAG TPA: site-2 protease family protein [Chthoniobacteraceae bacterium]|nr:site-2 protease family protein [Chthoniobacteraceae bacterium]